MSSAEERLLWDMGCLGALWGTGLVPILLRPAAEAAPG